MNFLILEDEKYNFDLLREMLKELMPDSCVYGPIMSIREGKEFFSSSPVRIDIIIADIQLNDGLSFYALTDAPADIPIIFTTAYDEYALKAFNYNSLSYLLKPVGEEELRKAINKARNRFVTEEYRDELYSMLARHLRYRERFVVNTYNGEKTIRISQIRYFVSEQKITFIKTLDGKAYELQQSLTSLEEELNPRDFMRVNRQFIVPLREVDELQPFSANRELLVLQGNNPPHIVISRDKRKSVTQWIR